MGMWDRLIDWLSGREDAAPQLPALAGPIDLMERREDSTWNPLTGLGGWKDKGAVARPSAFALQLTDRDLERSYANSGIARRIVDLLPNEATRKGWDAPEVPPDEEERLNVYENVADAGKMANLYGGAVGLMVTEDDIPTTFRRNPEAWLREPLDPKRVGALQALQIFDGYEAQPVDYERDVRLPGYRQPRIWSIAADGISVRVHASRLLYFRGQKRPPSQARFGWGRNNLMPDDSILQAIWDEVRHLIETHKGGAVLAQELSQSVLKIAELAPKQTGDEASAFKRFMARFQQSMGLLGMIVLGPNDSFERKATPVTGFKDLSEAAQSMLTLVLGWPRSMLSGEAPGGLSTDDEAGRERERRIISSYQEQRLRRPLEQFYRVLYASQDGPTRGRIPPEHHLVFAPLDEPTAQETADLRKTIAETDTLNVTLGAYGANDVAKSRFSPEGYSTEMLPVTPPDEAHQGLAAAFRTPAGLPVLSTFLDRGVLTEATAAQLLVLPKPPEPDPDEEAAIEAARQALAPGAPGGNVATDPARGDAISPDSVCLLVPAADPGLRAAVERAIGQSLTVEGALHVTLLFVGKGLDEAAIAEVVQVAGEEAGRATPGTLAAGSIRSFPIGDDGVPIVVEFSDTWAVQALHDGLLARLAHRVTAQQFRTYRPHITLGFAPAPLTVEAIGALAAVDASAVRVPISAVAVQVGETTRALIPAGGA